MLPYGALHLLQDARRGGELPPEYRLIRLFRACADPAINPRRRQCQWSGAAPSSSSAEDDPAGATHELLRLRKLCQLLEDQVVRRERAGPSLPPSSYMHPTPPPSVGHPSPPASFRPISTPPSHPRLIHTPQQMAYRPAPTPSSMARHVAAAERRALSEGDPRLVAPPPPRRISEAYPMTVATPFSSPSRHPASDPSRYHVADIDRPLPRSRSISEVAASRWRGPVVQTSSLRDS